MKYDFVVVGAGVAGITASLLLTKHGHSVALVEKSPQIAPVVRGFSRKGCHFDTGFHYTGGLGDGETLDLFFRYLGLSDLVEKHPFDENGFDRVRCIKSGFEFRFPIGFDRIRKALLEAFPQESEAINGYLDEVKDVLSRFPYINLDIPIEGSGLPGGVHGPSLQDVLDRLTDNSLLKTVLSLHALLYGVAPGEMPFALHASIVGPYYQSVHGLRGGGKSLVKAFEVLLKSYGVDVLCGKGVERVLFGDDKNVCGVELGDGARLEAESVVATLHPRLLIDMVPEGVFRPTYRRRIQSLEDTASAFIMYAKTGPAASELTRSNLLLFDSTRVDGFALNAEMEERPMYFSSAWQGEAMQSGGGFVAICPASEKETSSWEESRFGQRTEEYRLFKEKVSKRLQSHISRVAPEASCDFEPLEFATPLTMRDYSNAPGCGLYGVKHKVGQYDPAPRTRVKGLYLAGQATAAPGVMGAMLSGFLAVGSVVGHDLLREELKACS